MTFAISAARDGQKHSPGFEPAFVVDGARVPREQKAIQQLGIEGLVDLPIVLQELQVPVGDAALAILACGKALPLEQGIRKSHARNRGAEKFQLDDAESIVDNLASERAPQQHLTELVYVHLVARQQRGVERFV
jgi:hypothetical protein